MLCDGGYKNRLCSRYEYDFGWDFVSCKRLGQKLWNF